MHTHAHDLGLKAPGPHLLIGGLAGQADPGDEAWRALGRGIGLAGGEEPVEILPGLRSGPGRPEFDKTGAAPGLGTGANVHRRKPHQTRIVPDENGVTETLVLKGQNFPLHVQPGINGVGEPGCRGHQPGARRGLGLGIKADLPYPLHRPDRLWTGWP